MSASLEGISNEIKEANAHDVRGETKREKYLIFSLLDENYGMPLSTVKEVIGLTEITKVPNVAEYFKGIFNLRGKIISVFDLRTKLRLPKADYKEKKTCIIIVEIDGLVLGTIVDDVSAVSGFVQGQIERHLDIESPVSREFVTGVAKTEEKKLTLLLDIGKVLSVEDLKLAKANTIGRRAS